MDEDCKPPPPPELLEPLTADEMNQVKDKLFALQALQGTQGTWSSDEEDTQPDPVSPQKSQTEPVSLRHSGAEAEEEAMRLRSLRPMFEDVALVDQTAAAYEFRCRNGTIITIAQQPRLAARLEGDVAAQTEWLGSPTEASSATGAVVWDSTVVVARVLEHHTNFCSQNASTDSSNDTNGAPSSNSRSNPLSVSGKAVFELGAGCGLLSALMWHLGAAHVTSSERPELLPLLTENLQQSCSSPDAVQSGDSMRPARPLPRAVSHLWGAPLPPGIEQNDEGKENSCGGGSPKAAEFRERSTADDAAIYDLVVAVDCVYDEASVAPLLSSMCALGVGRRHPDHRSNSKATAGLVAIDSAYKRPRARAAFFKALTDFGLQATEVSGMDAACGEDYRETVCLWLIDNI
jgi:hypothetical protein